MNLQADIGNIWTASHFAGLIQGICALQVQETRLWGTHVNGPRKVQLCSTIFSPFPPPQPHPQHKKPDSCKPLNCAHA